MADLTVTSAVDTFMAAANQAAMLAALNITLGGAFATSGAFTTTLTVTGNTNVTLPTSGTLVVLGSNSAGSLTTASLSIGQTWNNAGTTCRGFEFVVTDTNSASGSTLARFLGGASGSTPLFSVTKTGTAWFNTSSGHAIQVDTSNNLPRLVAGYNGTNRSAILFNAAGAGVSPLLLSVSGDCLFGRSSTLTNTTESSAAFRGYGASFSSLTFTFGATNKDEAGAYTGAGHNVELVGGRGSSQSTGGAGGTASLIGGAAAGSGNNNGGSVIITGGEPSASGTRGSIFIGNNSADLLGFYAVTPVTRQVLATGSGATVDNVISFLQTIGLCKQS